MTVDKQGQLYEITSWSETKSLAEGIQRRWLDLEKRIKREAVVRDGRVFWDSHGFSELNVRGKADKKPRSGIRKRIEMYVDEIERRIPNLPEDRKKEAIQTTQKALKKDLDRGRLNREEHEMLLKKLDEIE